MAEYVTPEIPQDPAAIRDQMIDDLAGQGIQVRPATAMYFLLSVFAFLWAQLAEQSSQVFSTIFRYFGTKIARVPVRDAVSAATTVTFTADDDDGPYDIPIGTEINLRGADGTPVSFRTTTLATIPNGSTTVTPVTVVAATPGTSGNGLSALVGVTQTIVWLNTVTVLAPTAGGEDAQTDDEYQNDLADLLSLPVRTLARPVNFETYARRFPGVERALAVNAYPSPGHITVYVADADGLPVSGPTQAALLADFQELAITGLTAHIADPNYTVLDIAFTGVAERGYDPATVQARAEGALAAWVSPTFWGTPDLGDQINWREQLIVRYQDLSTVLNNVQGFDHHTALTINGAAADFTLAGPAALPDPTSTVNGTVGAP